MQGQGVDWTLHRHAVMWPGCGRMPAQPMPGWFRQPTRQPAPAQPVLPSDPHLDDWLPAGRPGWYPARCRLRPRHSHGSRSTTQTGPAPCAASTPSTSCATNGWKKPMPPATTVTWPRSTCPAGRATTPFRRSTGQDCYAQPAHPAQGGRVTAPSALSHGIPRQPYPPHLPSSSRLSCNRSDIHAMTAPAHPSPSCHRCQPQPQRLPGARCPRASQLVRQPQAHRRQLEVQKPSGFGPAGELIPAAGPFTHHRHNTVFRALDAEAVNLAGGLAGEPTSP